MELRTVITESSVWKFDLDLRRYLRFPRGEDPGKLALIAYTGEWDDFTAVERYQDRFLVHRPVPWGTGALRMTGPVEWHDFAELLEAKKWPAPETCNGSSGAASSKERSPT